MGTLLVVLIVIAGGVVWFAIGWVVGTVMEVTGLNASFDYSADPYHEPVFTSVTGWLLILFVGVIVGITWGLFAGAAHVAASLGWA